MLIPCCVSVRTMTDSVSVAPVRYPVVQISFKLHILNKRGWAREKEGRGEGVGEEDRKTKNFKHACRLFNTSSNANLLWGGKVKRRQEWINTDCWRDTSTRVFSDIFAQFWKHFYSKNHYKDILKQSATSSSNHILNNRMKFSFKHLENKKKSHHTNSTVRLTLVCPTE